MRIVARSRGFPEFAPTGALSLNTTAYGSIKNIVQRYKVQNTVNKTRPVNLDISTINLPITAIVSITHRVSGVILLGGIVILMWMLDASLRSEESFAALQDMLDKPVFKLIVWAIVASVLYHLVMGVRHLLMDLGIGESLEGGRLGAKLALIVSFLLIVAAAGWIFIW